MSERLEKLKMEWSVFDEHRATLSLETYYLSLFLAIQAVKYNTIPENVVDNMQNDERVKGAVNGILCSHKETAALFELSQRWTQHFDIKQIIDLMIDVTPLPFAGREDAGDISYSILPVIAEMIKEKQPQRTMDFCSGVGNAMILMAQNGAKQVNGVEINPTLSDISYLRLSVLQDQIKSFTFQVYNEDVFDYSVRYRDERFDFIFSEFPWGMRPFVDSPMANWHDQRKTLPKMPRNSDWKFIALANEHLANDGTAALLTPSSISYKQSDDAVRTHFLKEGYIEQVVRLPEKLLEYTGMSSFLLVLSRDNISVRFFDGNSLYTTYGRRRFLPEKEIPRFFDEADSSMVVMPTSKVLETNRLDPAYHVVAVYSNGQQLQDLAEIVRSKPIRKSELDVLLSEYATNVEFVRPKHINSGIIRADEFLKKVPESRSILQNEDVLISRVGSRIVCAVYETFSGMEAVADENLYVVRCDQGRLNPYYLLAYLQSDLGSKNLAARYEGAIISRISIDALRKLSIPTVPIVEQNAIGNEMKQFLLTTKRLRTELETLQDKIDDQLAEWFKG